MPRRSSSHQRTKGRRYTHTSMSVDDAVQRFTETANLIVLDGASGIGREYEARIRSHLTMRARGVPGAHNRSYQRTLRTAIGFIETAELTMPRDMMLVLLAAFSRDDLVTMNRSTRMDAMPRLVAAARTMTCPPMQQWAKAHVAIVDGQVQLIGTAGDNGGGSEAEGDTHNAGGHGSEDANDEDEDEADDEEDEPSRSNRNGNIIRLSFRAAAAGDDEQTLKSRAQFREIGHAVLSFAGTASKQLMAAVMAELQSLTPVAATSLGVPPAVATEATDDNGAGNTGEDSSGDDGGDGDGDSEMLDADPDEDDDDETADANYYEDT